MAKHSSPSRYYAEDKDVMDMLAQSTESRVRSFFLRRGIVLSPQMPKEDVLEYSAYCAASYPQAKFLVEALGRADREGAFTNERIDDPNFDLERLKRAVAVVKAHRESSGYVFDIDYTDKSATLKAAFIEKDYTRTRMTQGDNKDVKIELDVTISGLNVRCEHQPKAAAIWAEIEKKLYPDPAVKPPKRRILIGGLDCAQRISFFSRMARGIVGFPIVNEKGVMINRLNSDIDVGEGEGDEHNETEEHDEIEAQVTSAILNGAKVLNSEDFKRYEEAGFTISKLQWIVQAEDPLNGKVEFMARSDDGEKGSTFRFSVVGKYDFKDGGFTKQRMPVRDFEKRRLHGLLEESAHSALDAIRADGAYPRASVEIE